MLESSKEIGKFEEPLLKSVANFFKERGYDVSTHARLNIAWSNVISDIDVLAQDKKSLIIIEVKSDHDDFNHAFSQLQKLKGFANELYIATNKSLNKLNKNWKDNSIGLIYLNNQTIEVVKKAEFLDNLPANETISQLKKKCLVRLCNLLSTPKYLSKIEIEKRLKEKYSHSDLKSIIKKIVLCDCYCKDECILQQFLVTSCINLKETRFSDL